MKGVSVLDPHHRAMLRILIERAEQTKAIYPSDDGFVPTPGLQREVICDAALEEMVPLRLVERRRIPRPTFQATFAANAWRVTDAARRALASAEGGRDDA